MQNDERSTTVEQIANSLRVAARLEIEETDPDRLMPAVLAEMLFKQQHDPRDFLSYNLGATLDRVVGRVILTAVPDLLRLAEVLKEKGATPDAEYDFSYADKYASLVLSEPDRKAMAFRTQNINYLVFLRERHGKWGVHLREWYEELTDERFQAILRRVLADPSKPPTATEALALASHIAAFSNDEPGTPYPTRLSLRSFGACNWAAGGDSACRGLRYLDLRDTGFLASVAEDWRGDAEAERITTVSLSTLHYVWYDLLSVLDTLVLHPEDD